MGKSPLVTPEGLMGTQQTINMEQIVINRENFKNYKCGISDLYTVKSSMEGRETTSFYYVHFYPKVKDLPAISAITSESFTKLLGSEAGKKDDLLFKVIKEHEGEFCVEPIEGDNGLPVCFPDSKEWVWSLKKLAHSTDMDNWD